MEDGISGAGVLIALIGFIVFLVAWCVLAIRLCRAFKISIVVLLVLSPIALPLVPLIEIFRRPKETWVWFSVSIVGAAAIALGLGV